MSEAEAIIIVLTRIVNARLKTTQTSEQRVQNWMIEKLAQHKRDLYKSGGKVGRSDKSNPLRFEIAAIKLRIRNYTNRYPWPPDYLSALHQINSIEDCMAEFARKHAKNIVKLEQPNENNHIAIG